jgi:alpha-N-arabinofuranosidase
MIRTPRERWYDVGSGTLTLRARPFGFGAAAQPSFLGRRQQHMYASASTAMRYAPAKAGDKAGLVAFQNDEYYFLLAVAWADGQPVVQLETHAGRRTPAGGALVASAPMRAAPGAPIYLKIQARGPRYDFWYAERAGEWRLLAGDVDGTILSTRVAGGFVGTMLGLYAYTKGDT